MGAELAPGREWDHDRGLDWELLETRPTPGVGLVADLNQLYRNEPALHELDCEPGGLRLGAGRRGRDQPARLPRAMRPEVRCWSSATSPRCPGTTSVGVPVGGYWQELLNSDAESTAGAGRETWAGSRPTRARLTAGRGRSR